MLALCVSAGLTVASTALFLGEPNDATCALRLWLCASSPTALAAALAAKVLRVRLVVRAQARARDRARAQNASPFLPPLASNASATIGLELKAYGRRFSPLSSWRLRVSSSPLSPLVPLLA